MNLRQIETFLAVIEEGTFSAGATRLKVSQPTVSKLIDSLERGLGYKLFRRMGARVVPTDQGMALYREMTRVKRGFDLLLDQAGDLKGNSGGRLVIGVGSALAPAFMPALIARFLARHPEAHVTFEADGARYLIEHFLAGSIDIGFAYVPTPDAGLLGFVDVPGHERFVRNMLAGVCGIDLALLVSASGARLIDLATHASTPVEHTVDMSARCFLARAGRIPPSIRPGHAPRTRRAEHLGRPHPGGNPPEPQGTHVRDDAPFPSRENPGPPDPLLGHR